MYYHACTACKKKVLPEQYGYRCENCQKSYDTANTSYNFSFRLSDVSTSMYVQALGEQGEAIVGLSARDFE